MKAEIKGKELIITLDYDKDGVASKSGKSKIHASTHGNQAITVAGRTLHVGANVYSKGA